MPDYHPMCYLPFFSHLSIRYTAVSVECFMIPVHHSVLLAPNHVNNLLHYSCRHEPNYFPQTNMGPFLMN